MVDTLVLETSGASRVGSSPTTPTIFWIGSPKGRGNRLKICTGVGSNPTWGTLLKGANHGRKK